jgi:hypothetical protein
MFPKHEDRLQFRYGAWLLGRNSPHLLYANLDFSGADRPKRVGQLLVWLDLYGPDWPERQTLQFLKKHQEDFRRSVEWLSDGSRADFSAKFDPKDEESERLARDQWAEEPAVKFLQLHGLTHGGVALEPVRQADCVFEGLQLWQERPRDPLDPICWHMLSLLAHYGTVFIRGCRRWKCRNFFWPQTPRKLFCSDSCRAIYHVEEMELNGLLEGEAKSEIEKFREHRREYMKKYRALPQVKRRSGKR